MVIIDLIAGIRKDIVLLGGVNSKWTNFWSYKSTQTSPPIPRPVANVHVPWGIQNAQ